MPSALSLLADAAEFFGATDVSGIARAGARAQGRVSTKAIAPARGVKRATSNLVSGIKHIPGNSTNLTAGAISPHRKGPGLPNYRDSGKYLTGATTGIRQRAAQRSAAAIAGVPGLVTGTQGRPQMTMQGGRETPVTVTIELKSGYAGKMTAADHQYIDRIASRIEQRARAMSRGQLTYKKLAEKNHPYGRGLFAPHIRVNGKNSEAFRRRGYGRLRGQRKGVSNLAITNIHTGEFYQSWSSRVVWSRTGAKVQLINRSTKAGYLAFGTRKMRAHGPFTTAPAMYADALNKTWRLRAQAAYYRESNVRRPR